MKKIVLSISAFLLAFSLQAQNVTIPDSAFLSQLLADGGINLNDDNFIQLSEAQQATYMYYYNAGIEDLTGIEEFINLDYVNLQLNDISTIDVSNNPKIDRLLLSGNSNISSLDVSMLPNLLFLYIAGTQISSLDLSNNNKLEALNASNTNINSLILNDHDSLEQLIVNDCNLTSLDISGLGKLKILTAHRNQLDTIIAGTHPDLYRIGLNQTNISTVQNLLSPQIQNLIIWENDLTELDLSTCSGLKLVYAHRTKLQNVTMGTHPSLSTLDFGGNFLDSIDISGCTNLYDLRLYSNGLKHIEFGSQHSALVELNLNSNLLVELDVREIDSLSEFTCKGNPNLERLNMANGSPTMISVLDLIDNPMLSCINVDDTAYFNSNFSTDIDSGAAFSENCSYLLSTNPVLDKNSLKFYPNPTTDLVYFNEVYDLIEVYSIQGQLLLRQEWSDQIDLTNFDDGNYIIRARTGQNFFYEKLVKH